ncbi:MAG TPA: sugar phosphate isomerase/epimerase family protein [Bryobacteraceae bacterium]|nr:sugar phosphate isomerase/epimerase family protein [Bryobacteraceae bacterium]
MDNVMTRRSAIGAGLMSGMAAGMARAAAPAKVQVKVGLYTITYLGLWYRGDALTHEQLIERAKKFGFEGIELDGKRPHGNPLDMPKKRCDEFRKRAQGEGVPIYAVSGNNDFSSPVPEYRESQLVYMRELIKMTADLGAKTLRVFLAWPGVTVEPLPKGGGRYDIAHPIWQFTHEKFSPEQTWAWCRQGLVESAKCAKDQGVTLALQNHRPVIDDYPDVLRMVKEVDSPGLKVCLDAPLLKQKDETSVRKAALDVGSLQMLSHFGGEFDEAPDGSVKGGEPYYKPFLKAMAEIGYTGYIGYELCHPLPVVDGKTVGLEFADKNARLAVKFMRGVIAEANKELGAA